MTFLYQKHKQKVYRFSKEHIKAYKLSRKVKHKEVLCKAPFGNLYFSRNGDVLACCFNRDLVLGKYPLEKPDKIWKSSNAKKFRKTISEKRMPAGCEVCVREFQKENYQAVVASQFDFLNIKRKYPVMMEFELDNTCNLECIMCEGDLSSSIRINREGKKKTPTPYDDNFIEYIKPWLKKAELLRFGGGEPFLIPIYFKIWDIVLKENPNCKIYVQTNATIINDRIRQWLASGQFELGVSLDSLNKELFESIRVNAKFDEVLNNIDEFINIMPLKDKDVSLVISATVLRENWKDVPELLNFANNKNAQIVFNTVWNPKQHAIHNLSCKELKQIIEYYSKHPAKTNNEIEIHNSKMYLGLINQVKGWHKDTSEKEQAIIKYKPLSIEQLENHLKEMINNQKDNKNLLSDKLTSLISSLSNQSNYKEYLIIMCLSSKEKSINALNNFNTNQLISILKQELGNETGVSG